MMRSALIASLAAAASAHQNMHQIWVNGVSPGYEAAVRMPPSNSPVTDVQSDDIACNVVGTNAPTDVVAANEGDEITVGWDPSSHPGPITHMLMAVDDATSATGVGAGWFKIDELDNVDGVWANEVVSDNGGNYTFTLPTGLESGQYLLRSEMLALHGAQEIGGGQFYIGCAQLTITGTGGGCTPTISLPGAYDAEDDSIYIPDVYNGFDASTYTAPGGAVAVCGGGSGSTPVTSTPAAATSSESAAATTAASTSSAAAPSIPTSTAQPATTLITATSSGAAPSSTAGTAEAYGQCGGSGFTGATACAAGSTCTSMNDYYSQCVPNQARRTRNLRRQNRHLVV